MFKKWFSSKSPKAPTAPEVLGLYLGGSFEIDALKLKLITPQLTIENPASQHLIQAVGKAELDSGGTIIRFYTDDDAFLQVVLDGGMSENHVTDVKLWYFYSTTTVGSQSQWQACISQGISQPVYTLEGHRFNRVWNSVGDASPPVAVTEHTYEEDGDVSETDQFMMLYERTLDDATTESLLVAGEEKIIGQNADRCLVISTGFDIQPADIRING